MSKNRNRKINRKRLFFSITPLVVLLAAIIALNFIPESESAVVTVPTETAVAISTQPTTVATPTLPPILQATVLPSPTPTITPRPNVSATANFTLYGPPNEAILPLDGRITFYWHYSEPLSPGQELMFTLSQNNTLIASMQLNQPNFGDGYQTLVELEENAIAGTAVWQVHLQWQDEEFPLITSEERTLIIVQN